MAHHLLRSFGKSDAESCPVMLHDRPQAFLDPVESSGGPICDGAQNRTQRNDTLLGMNRYLLFTYYAGRPWGGMKDFLDSFESIDEALENLLPEPTRYIQVVDRDSLVVVKEGLSMFKDAGPETFAKGENWADE